VFKKKKNMTQVGVGKKGSQSMGVSDSREDAWGNEETKETTLENGGGRLGKPGPKSGGGEQFTYLNEGRKNGGGGGRTVNVH